MKNNITITGIELIKKLEGFSNKPYICKGGYSTIGYGHKILKNENFKSIISLEEAEILLNKDLNKSESAIYRFINIKLNNNQHDALISFTFNVGAAALQRSTLRQKINYGNFYDGANEFLKWIYIGIQKSPGLILRRKLERNLFLK